MNDNNVNNDRYRATSNLNTAIENPQINVSDATDVNVKDLNYNNYVNNTNTDVNNTFLNNTYVNQNNDGVSDYATNNNNSNINSSNNLNINSNVNEGTSSDVNIQTNSYITSSSGDKINYSYEPTLNEKKVEESGFISNLLHSKEFKILIFIMFILCIFLLVMPYVYDFIRNLH